MSEVEYYPVDHPGLPWEATAPVDEHGDVAGFVLARAGACRIAVANVADRHQVLLVEPQELRALRDALLAGRFDHLWEAGGH
ncbi:hypothetical protein ACWCYY_27760 [Kitasatospora sp. NPDC001664]